MALYLLDTDAIIDQIKGIELSGAFLRRLIAGGNRFCTCEVVIAEVFSGLLTTELAVAEPLLGSLVFLPSSPDIGRQAGTWRYRFARQGIAITTTDALIAATALFHNAIVVTGNIRDYPMREIVIEAMPRRTR